ncbi:hypothetical protein BDY17DRAFT_288882 [Neohortaea acidophila]|uniref:FAD-binding domain-containing protein n=1 Tax=Neohortaea acidophila TaxID=245834 RepID=A0A6A6Q4U6_9PEZI|nr:uncharacterized protein BDY17DRAFT_288882 [Neohortaea acidophila]KAF2487390.1 hypothetical protein BDY17DRAFT_288882 [Neohortaea acidophila]
MAAASARKPILISGGGLASLLLARSLLRSKIPFVVFERDASLIFRAQGYRLRMSNEGLDAIEEVLGPGFDKFWQATSKTGGAKGFGLLNAVTGEDIEQDGTTQVSKGEQQAAGGSYKVPEKLATEKLQSRGGKTIGISRGDMRALFMEGCEPFIRWDHHVVSYELTDHGVKAVFADGSKSEEGEMLIGGEGIYSKVAKQLSDGKLKTYDTGARGIHGQSPATAFKGLGEGVWRLIDSTNPQGQSFIITNVRPEDMDDPKADLGWTMSATPGVINPPNNNFQIVGETAANMAKSLTANWHPKYKPLFDEMRVKEAAFWKITCSTPSGVPVWKNENRVTVIGDAVHSMTPAGGIGANTAMRDSALLGRLLGEAGGYKEGLTAAYEEKMRVYASEAVAQSYGLASSTFQIKIDENTTPVVGAESRI